MPTVCCTAIPLVYTRNRKNLNAEDTNDTEENTTERHVRSYLVLITGLTRSQAINLCFLRVHPGGSVFNLRSLKYVWV